MVIKDIMIKEDKLLSAISRKLVTDYVCDNIGFKTYCIFLFLVIKNPAAIFYNFLLHVF